MQSLQGSVGLTGPGSGWGQSFCEECLHQDFEKRRRRRLIDKVAEESRMQVEQRPGQAECSGAVSTQEDTGEAVTLAQSESH